MAKDKSAPAITACLKKLHLNPNSSSNIIRTLHSSTKKESDRERTKPPSLLSLCLGFVGKNLEDLIQDLAVIALNFPPHIKMAIAAIARRRKLLNDDAIISLADSSWQILDVSGSDVSDSGLVQLSRICTFIRAVDISRCNRITASGVSELVQLCHLLETLRCGGCPRSDHTARRCLGILKPKLNVVEEDSWEELDPSEISHGAQSLRWLVWPKIDKDSLEILTTECPRIIVNPNPSPFAFRVLEVPREALQNIDLDNPYVKDIDPKTWAVYGLPKAVSPSTSSPTELSMAEKFRLAFVERDTRLAPKRAKNARQHQRRAEREWMMTSTSAKAIALASKATKSLHSRN
ncbi:hypothetical protein CFOL_v3_16405 [Cephalotus follicularis]|uniref:RNI-like superfamily protein n=1 Tax=Cephalotus follicularis TaxID=3775 RepID=A0A1Q3BY85_CEPFO|nr:hypothetical protein CFOL_v3_16405 [Cephalotus follicularis]